MEIIDRVIVSLIYYNSCVRDTLEYTLNREVFDVNLYDHKKRVLTEELKVNSPLKVFLDRQGENGAKTIEQINNFIEEIYGDESTVVKKAPDGLRVDHAQNIKIFQAVIPLYENLNSIVRIHANYAAEQKIKHETVDQLVYQNERFYRAVALLTLSNELYKQFDEFNKVMRESNGEKTPQSNFIENDLNTIAQLFNTTRQNSVCRDSLYTDALDSVTFALEMMNGRRDLPQGKTFGDVFQDSNAKISKFVQDAESKWKELYTPALNELIEDTKAAQPAQEVKA
jgi:hypothetical protein